MTIELERVEPVTEGARSKAVSMLQTQRRAVLLTDDPLDRPVLAMTVLWRAAANLSRESWQILDDIPVRVDAWTDSATQATREYDGLGRTGVIVNPLKLAYSNKYGTPNDFSSDKPILVSLDHLTTNKNSHAWTYFAPILRRAELVLAWGQLGQLNKYLPLIELIHHMDKCVVLADRYENCRLG